MADWIANGESGADIRAKLNSVPNDGDVCTAVAAPYTAQGVVFDGASNVHTDAPLVGVVNGPKFLAVYAVNVTHSSEVVFVCGLPNDDLFASVLNSSGSPILRIQGWDAAFAPLFDIQSGVVTESVWHTVVVSVDVTNPSGQLQYVIDGVFVDTSGMQLGNGSIDYAGQFFFAADGFGGFGTEKAANVQLWFGIAPDLTDPSNLAVLIDDGGKLVDPALAVAKFGNPAISFVGDASAFGTNGGTAGVTSVTGTLTDAATSPSATFASTPGAMALGFTPTGDQFLLNPVQQGGPASLAPQITEIGSNLITNPTFDADGTIASFSDNGDGGTTVTLATGTTPTGVYPNNRVSITDASSYNGGHDVFNVVEDVSFDIDVVFSSDDATGSFMHSWQLYDQSQWYDDNRVLSNSDDEPFFGTGIPFATVSGQQYKVTINQTITNDKTGVYFDNNNGYWVSAADGFVFVFTATYTGSDEVLWLDFDEYTGSGSRIVTSVEMVEVDGPITSALAVANLGGESLLRIGGDYRNNFSFGVDTGPVPDFGVNNIFLGNNSGLRFKGDNAIVVGSGSLNNFYSVGSTDLIVLGRNAAQQASSVQGVIIGNRAAKNTGTVYGTYIGVDVAKNNGGAVFNSTIIGSYAGLEGPSFSVIVGEGAAQNATGDGSVVIGYAAGYTITTGRHNTLLGALTDVSAGARTNAIAIGYGAVVLTDDTVQLGRATTPVVRKLRLGDTIIFDNGVLHATELRGINGGSITVYGNDALSEGSNGDGPSLVGGAGGNNSTGNGGSGGGAGAFGGDGGAATANDDNGGAGGDVFLVPGVGGAGHGAGNAGSDGQVKVGSGAIPVFNSVGELLAINPALVTAGAGVKNNIVDFTATFGAITPLNGTEVTQTINGLLTTDQVHVECVSAPPSGYLPPNARVSAADTLALYFNTAVALGITLGSLNFRVTVLR